LNDRELLVALYREAVGAVEAEAVVSRSLQQKDPGTGPFFVLGAGKAACAMARGARAVLGERIIGGSVVTKAGHGLVVDGIAVREAAHPLPDARSVAAAEEALYLARSCPESHGLLVLLSGGASALWTAPTPPLQLMEKRAVSEVLIRAGADIHALNTVRKHLSRIKGGGLLGVSRAARCLTLAISDVAGDLPESIGSGPTTGDPTSYADALAVLREGRLADQVPRSVLTHLEAGAAGKHPETAPPGDPIFENAEYRIAARLRDALSAAAEGAERRGLRVRRLGEMMYGEARHVARRLAEEVRLSRQEGSELLIAGGEPTVRVRGKGKGGRAQELALAFALELRGEADFSALIAGTDGSDGPTDAAGGLVDGESLRRAHELGLDPRAHLDQNDAYPLLKAIGDLFVTGPTRTNVTDLALIRVRRSLD
jgi:hydroxypyruvate reductase